MPKPKGEWVPVAVWELTRMMKRKDFVISVLMVPLIALGAGLISAWIKRYQERETHRIAVVAADPLRLPPLKGFNWVTPAPGEATPEALARAIQTRKLEGALIIPSGFARGDTVRTMVRRESPGWIRKVEKHLLEQARLQRAAAHGLGAADLEGFDRPVTLDEQLAVPRARTSKGDRMLALVCMMLATMAIFVTGSYMSIGITGEKQARVTEVIVSAIRPQSWIDGKIVAYTVLGLALAALWTVSFAILGVMFSWTLPPSVNGSALALFALFSVLGLAFYTALYAMILATIKDMMSTQKFQAYLFFLPMIPLFFLEAVIQNPDAPWVVAVSLLPMFSPILMPMRIAVSGVAAWEIAGALVLLALAVHLMRLAAGHAFRIGMLMYGKELSLPELVRWSKQA